MKCHTRYPGMNVAISRRGHSMESSRELDGLISGSETSDYIPTSNKVSCCDAVIGQA